MLIDKQVIYIFIATMIGLQGWILRKLSSLETTNAVQNTEIQNMKNHLTAAKLLGLAILCILFVGCAAVKKTTDTIENVFTRPGTTNVVAITNFVDRIVEVPTVGMDRNREVLVTNLVLVTNHEPFVVYSTNVQYIVQPTIDKIEAGGHLVAPFIPPPYNAPIEVGLGLLSSVALWIAKKRNGQATSAIGAAVAVIKGVEKFAATIPGGEKVKDHIDAAAKSLGVSDDLHLLVKANT